MCMSHCISLTTLMVEWPFNIRVTLPQIERKARCHSAQYKNGLRLLPDKEKALSQFCIFLPGKIGRKKKISTLLATFAVKIITISVFHLMLATCIYTMWLCVLSSTKYFMWKSIKIISQVWLAALLYLFKPFVSPYAMQFGDLVDIVAVLDQ